MERCLSFLILSCQTNNSPTLFPDSQLVCFSLNNAYSASLAYIWIISDSNVFNPINLPLAGSFRREVSITFMLVQSFSLSLLGVRAGQGRDDRGGEEVRRWFFPLSQMQRTPYLHGMSVIQTWLGVLDANACTRRLKRPETCAVYGNPEGFFPLPNQFSDSPIPTGRPTIQCNSGTNYPELVQTPWVKGSHKTVPTSDDSCKSWATCTSNTLAIHQGFQ